LESNIQNTLTTTTIPSKNICAIISNPNGEFRNIFIEKLESNIKIDFAGEYKNNIKIIEAQYNTKEFRDKISNYKFILSLENSQDDTYITEKITHGFLANTIPIYWGSPRINDYFNSERFININSNDDIDAVIKKIVELINNPTEYLNMVNKPVYKNNKNQRTIGDIVKDIRNLINERKFQLLDQIYFVNSYEFEPESNSRLIKDFIETLGVSIENISFISPTYKTTITDEIYKKYVKSDLMLPYCNRQFKKSELSLALNYKAILENIEKNYKDGIFLILESDVLLLNNILELNSFLELLKPITDKWDLIHIGYDNSSELSKDIFRSPYCTSETPYRNYQLPNINFIEDLTVNSQYRIIRKFHTRCTDSFIWSYNGIVKFLNYMNVENNYGVAFDYYLTNFLENNKDFKHYWSKKTYLIQGSNHGIIRSTIQQDNN